MRSKWNKVVNHVQFYFWRSASLPCTTWSTFIFLSHSALKSGLISKEQFESSLNKNYENISDGHRRWKPGGLLYPPPPPSKMCCRGSLLPHPLSREETPLMFPLKIMSKICSTKLHLRTLKYSKIFQRVGGYPSPNGGPKYDHPQSQTASCANA